MPAETGEEACPFQTALELLGRRHVLPILWALQQRHPRRFTDFRRALGVNPATLSDRLGQLEDCGVVSRQVYHETPPRVDYDLTTKGLALLALLDHLDRWSRKYPMPTGARGRVARGRRERNVASARPTG